VNDDVSDGVHDGDLKREVERLSAVLIPYLCERTGLSHAEVESVMDAQEEFWDSQKHVIGRMFILGFEVNGEDE